MTESGSVAANVEALRTATVPTLHAYAVSESAWVLAQLGRERAALARA
jgi:hypothetical protein